MRTLQGKIRNCLCIVVFKYGKTKDILLVTPDDDDDDDEIANSNSNSDDDSDDYYDYETWTSKIEVGQVTFWKSLAKKNVQLSDRA